MQTPAALLALLAPPRCVACGVGCGGEAQLCRSCEATLAAARTPAVPPLIAIEAAWAAFTHECVARELVVALKFRGLLPVAGLIAELIAQRAPERLLSATLVPVPPAPARLRRRGFDPAEEIAERLMDVTRLPCAACLQRADGPRQVGRSRTARIAQPPLVRAKRAVPREVVLVDDVTTTGATLSACAQVLREAGAARVSAVTFARTP